MLAIVSKRYKTYSVLNLLSVRTISTLPMYHKAVLQTQAVLSMSVGLHQRDILNAYLILDTFFELI